MKMYIQLLLWLLAILGQWKQAEATCTGMDLCDMTIPGVTYTSCPDVTGTGGGEPPLTIPVQCGDDDVNMFTTSPTKFETPPGVDIFIITDLVIPQGVIVTIGLVVCPSGDCAIMKLDSDAQAEIMFKVEMGAFRIHTSPASAASDVTLKFRCINTNRGCSKGAYSGRMRRMVNSIEAVPNEFPWMARLSLYYTKANSGDDFSRCNLNGYKNDLDTRRTCASGRQIKKLDCGGSIIHKNWILSVAHCFKDIRTINGQAGYRLMGVLVTVGDHLRTGADPNRETRWVPKQMIFKHPGLDNPSRFNNDIALLKLKQAINLKKSARYPICLPPESQKNNKYLGSEVTLAGWGVESNFIPTNELKKEYFNIATNEYCNTIFSAYNVPITDKMICTINEDSHPCYGDGGGPVWCTAADNIIYQIGIISFASTDLTTIWKLEEPNGNTRVTEYLDWIKTKVAPDVLP